jgi:hypothetical protein
VAATAAVTQEGPKPGPSPPPPPLPKKGEEEERKASEAFEEKIRKAKEEAAKKEPPSSGPKPGIREQLLKELSGYFQKKKQQEQNPQDVITRKHMSAILAQKAFEQSPVLDEEIQPCDFQTFNWGNKMFFGMK